MINDSLVIMAGGASSRMKKSLNEVDLESQQAVTAKAQHKSLIPLNHKGTTMLHLLLNNALEAGIGKVYIITSTENKAFQDFIEQWFDKRISIFLAIQYLEAGREKPLGTADALLQCMEQHPILQQELFTVCNGDNLYSAMAMKLLKNKRATPHATIAYSARGLGFDEDRLARFAVMQFDSSRHLKQIIEKPDPAALNLYKDSKGELFISMNIFNFTGNKIIPYLRACPVHPERQEKELPEAVKLMLEGGKGVMTCIPRDEKIPDLTTAKDVLDFHNWGLDL